MGVVSLRKSRKRLVVSLAVPLAVGGLSALLTRDGMERFKGLRKPPLTPPGWVFPAAWTILFVLMGIASYLAWKNGRSRQTVRRALALYGVQLGFNFLWSMLFFNGGMYLAAFFELIVLWLLILLTTVRFYRLSKPAGYLMAPYLLWVAFAGYLNFGAYLLN